MKDRLKQLRLESGVSQAEFAKRIGVSQAAVAQWEKGTTTPSSSQLAHVSLVFGVSQDWLSGASESKTQDYDYAVTIAALALFRQLPPEAQRAVNDVLEFYLKHGQSPYQEI